HDQRRVGAQVAGRGNLGRREAALTKQLASLSSNVTRARCRERSTSCAGRLAGFELQRTGAVKWDANVKTNAEATPPQARARITGIVYLLYFLTAVSDEVFVGRGH